MFGDLLDFISNFHVISPEMMSYRYSNENGFWTKGTLFLGCYRIQHLASAGKENRMWTSCYLDLTAKKLL